MEQRERSAPAGRPGLRACRPAAAGVHGPDGAHGRLPLAVAVVDAAGLVSHWSRGAVELFGHSYDEAVGAELSDLLPVLADLDDDVLTVRPSTLAGQPRSGWARMPQRDGVTREVLWWLYPLPRAWRERSLVLATDAALLGAARGGRADRTRNEVREASPGFLPLDRLPDGEELARRFTDVMPRMGPQAATRIARHALGLGYPVLDLNLRRRVPVTPYWGEPAREVRTPAAPAHPALFAVGDQRADDLENAAVRERLEFLNGTSGRIGHSLDLAQTIREVTEAAVPRFADFAGTHLRDAVLAGEGFPEGPPDASTVMHRVWVAHDDEPGRWDDTVPAGETFAFPADTPFHQCMVTGEPVLIPVVGDELADRIASRFEKRDLRPLITGRSLLVVPLKARRVVLGFMVLLRRPDRAPFDEMDRTTGAELAARAGLVLDNARLYTYQENTAETLQESMLPKDLPQPAGLEAAYRYLPGTRLGKVGGDWFDTIPLPGGRVALVVGDVMGHGIGSAATMGQLRTAVQTLAGLDLPPDQILRRLDDLAQRLGESCLATCLYAVYDPVAREVRIANAGHIPPVLQDPLGAARLLDLPSGAPIGVGGVPFETVTVPVPDGSRVLLCTDGLVEVRGRDIGLGLAALTGHLSRPGSDLEASCDALIRALNAVGRRDDVALLLCRLTGIPREDVAEWSFAAAPAEARRARVLTRSTMLEWGRGADAETAVLLVDELVGNALRHARTRAVTLRLVLAGTLMVEVSDDDHRMPVLVPADGDGERGRGLRLVSRIAGRWGCSRTDRGKTVWFELPLHPRGAERPAPPPSG